MSTIGYARVSTRDQNPDYEKHRLLRAGGGALVCRSRRLESSQTPTANELTVPEVVSPPAQLRAVRST